MPLLEGHSAKIRSKNIAELINSGKPPKQAEAIAYKKSGEDDTISKREYDLNGWPEIPDNPISKVGVFDYLGSQIDTSLVPDRIYKVYRPASELQDPECIESFCLVPWTDEHAMLGTVGEGLTPPEKKGIHGVIGENVYFDGTYLRGNLKVFSTDLAQKIENGKKELSIGYRCLYELTSGVYDGQHYDAIQRRIRGNHIASVHEGRSGPDIAVQDHFKITFDSGELIMPVGEDKKAKDEETMDSLRAQCDALEKENVELRAKDKKTKDKKAKDKKAEDVEPDDFVKKAHSTDEDMDDEPGAYDEKEDDEEEKDTKDSEQVGSPELVRARDKKAKDKGHGMDAKIVSLTAQVKKLTAAQDEGVRAVLKEVSQRDALVKRLTPAIGVFDHSEKTLREVQKYAVKKLGLTCQDGHEEAALAGYLAAYQPHSAVQAFDSVAPSDTLMSYIKECG